jgi:hypothetical protein
MTPNTCGPSFNFKMLTALRAELEGGLGISMEERQGMAS